MKKFSFPKTGRILKNSQFRRIFRNGVRLSDGLVELYIIANDCGYPRAGVSISRLCGGAVVRNRLKRLLKEVFRQNKGKIPQSRDYLLMISRQWFREVNNSAEPKKMVNKLGFKQVESSFLALIDEAANKKRR